MLVWWIGIRNSPIKFGDFLSRRGPPTVHPGCSFLGNHRWKGVPLRPGDLVCHGWFRCQDRKDTKYVPREDETGPEKSVISIGFLVGSGDIRWVFRKSVRILGIWIAFGFYMPFPVDFNLPKVKDDGWVPSTAILSSYTTETEKGSQYKLYTRGVRNWKNMSPHSTCVPLLFSKVFPMVFPYGFSMAQVYSWWFMAWPLLCWCWSSSFHHPWSTPKGRVTMLSTSSRDARWHLGREPLGSLEKTSTNGG